MKFPTLGIHYKIKREHVLALCLLAVAIYFVIDKGITDSWFVPSASERGRGQKAGENSKAVSLSDGDHKQGKTRHSLRGSQKEFVTDSGLVYLVREEGTGEHPGPNSTVKVHYDGMLVDGTVFDSSRERGEPMDLPLNAVIKGWTEGLQLMKPGAKYRFEIPPNLAYGDSGAGETIPPGATLIFEIELISIEKP